MQTLKTLINLSGMQEEKIYVSSGKVEHVFDIDCVLRHSETFPYEYIKICNEDLKRILECPFYEEVSTKLTFMRLSLLEKLRDIAKKMILERDKIEICGLNIFEHEEVCFWRMKKHELIFQF